MTEITNAQLQDYLKLIEPFTIDCDKDCRRVGTHLFQYHLDRSFGELVYFNSDITIYVDWGLSHSYPEDGRLRIDPAVNAFYIDKFEMSQLYVNGYEMLNEDQLDTMENYLKSIIEAI